MSHGELHGKFCNIDTSRLAVLGSCLADAPYLGCRLVPGWQRCIGQKSCREGRGVHDAYLLFLEVGNLVSKHRVLERVVVIGKDHVQVGLFQDEAKVVHGIAGDTDKPHLARLLDFSQLRDRFIDDLLAVHEFDVMA